MYTKQFVINGSIKLNRGHQERELMKSWQRESGTLRWNPVLRELQSVETGCGREVGS